MYTHGFHIQKKNKKINPNNIAKNKKNGHAIYLLVQKKKKM